MRRFGLSVLLLSLSPAPAKACGLALALLVDISGSVDPGEYRTQIDGLAEALRDGVVTEALVRQRAAVTLIQWTGSSRQDISVPWVEIESADDLEDFAARVARVERPWAMFATAIGEALTVAEAEFAAAPDCTRRVIDVSGDGASNEGVDPATVRDRLVAQGITVNALVITSSEPELVPYFKTNVIGGHGAFAMSANGYADYPERIRRKLIRETASVLSELRMPAPHGHESPQPHGAGGATDSP